MSYMALYRKWRPRDFDGVVGQDPIVTALKNQIQYQRIGHAYLFCGTRGTGKTSTAKIFARAVNCLNPRDGNPCNECELCQEAETGFNVVEIDAASNNGVDNIREIREEVKYTPAKGRYKVYIIDEVHMLSAGAFNALLKTLEEPPEHIIFILATTEPHKILPTILSRCQRYDFRCISTAQIARQLATLTEKEGLEADEDALQYIARMADGAMRDALSILDQCSSFYLGQRITLEKVYDVLGAVDTQIFYEATRALAGGDAMACLQCVDEIFSKGRDPSQFLTDWISHLRDALMTKALGTAGVELLEISPDRGKSLAEQAQSLRADQLTYFITQLSKLESQIKYSSQKRVLIEVGLLQLCHPEDDHTDEALRSRLDAVEQKLASGPPPQPGVDAATPPKPRPPRPEKARQQATAATASHPAAGAVKELLDRWQDLKRRLIQEQPSFYLLNMMTLTPGEEEDSLFLVTGKAIYRDQMNQKNGEKLREIEAFLEKNTGVRYRILAVTDGELQKGAPPAAENDLSDVIKNIHSDITWE